MADAPDHFFAAEVSTGAKALGALLWRHASHKDRLADPFVFPSVKKLSAILRQDARSTRRQLEALRDALLIEETRRKVHGEWKRGWVLASHPPDVDETERAQVSDADVSVRSGHLRPRDRDDAEGGHLGPLGRASGSVEADVSVPRSPKKPQEAPLNPRQAASETDVGGSSGDGGGDDRSRAAPAGVESLRLEPPEQPSLIGRPRPGRREILDGHHDRRTKAALARDTMMHEVIVGWWRRAVGKPKSDISPKRLKAVRKAFEAGYKPSRVLRAVEGISQSDQHMGRDPDKPTAYCDVHNALGPMMDTFIEAWVDLWPARSLDGGEPEPDWMARRAARIEAARAAEEVDDGMV